ncbi:hypothetical protein AB0F93_03555 [Micromonospora tulbaghiae]|uniref:hypothetical protein n=1 Tax=Micromonospora tulbaghiae TaxID=479978 RepID=UPI0033307A25
MSMAAIRRAYQVPAKRGMKVIAHRSVGTITGSDGPLLRIRLDGEKRARIYHPTWRIQYPGWHRTEQQHTRHVQTVPLPGVSW